MAAAAMKMETVVAPAEYLGSVVMGVGMEYVGGMGCDFREWGWREVVCVGRLRNGLRLAERVVGGGGRNMAWRMQRRTWGEEGWKSW